MQDDRGRLFRASRSYADRRDDAVRCPIRSLALSTRDVLDGLRSEQPRHEALTFVQYGVSVAFAIIAIQITANWDSSSIAFTMRVLL